MQPIKSALQVRTRNSIKSFRAIPNATGISMAHVDKARMERAEILCRRAEDRQRRLARPVEEESARS